MSKRSNGPRISFSDVLMNSLFLRAPARLREVSAEAEAVTRTDEDVVVVAEHFVEGAAANSAESKTETEPTAKPGAKAEATRQGRTIKLKGVGSKSGAGRVRWMNSNWDRSAYHNFTKTGRGVGDVAGKFQSEYFTQGGIKYLKDPDSSRVLGIQVSDPRKKGAEEGESAPKDEK